MRVLIVEDNAFNAFCLRRLLESMKQSVSVTIVNNSRDALSLINYYLPDIVILDGDLGAKGTSFFNGPELANHILQKYPSLPIIAWSDSDLIKKEFAGVLIRYNKLLNEYSIWPKVVSSERIDNTFAYYFEHCAAMQPARFSMRSVPIRSGTY